MQPAPPPLHTDICIGVETKYVTRGAEGQRHTKTNNATTTSVTNHANMHILRTYVPMSIETNTNTETQPNVVTKSGPRRERRGMLCRTKKRYGKAGRHHGMKHKVAGRRGMNATRRPPGPHTPYTLHTLSIGETQGMTKRYVMEPTHNTCTRGPGPPQDGKEAAWYGKQQYSLGKGRQEKTGKKGGGRRGMNTTCRQPCQHTPDTVHTLSTGETHEVRQ